MLNPSLKRIFLPGIILQSVLIGGGYATGREIVEYGAKFGASGWVCGLAIFFGFSLMSFLSIEACRQWQVYDYKSLLKRMIGPAWVAYEIVYLLLAILIIAVMASAAGEILHTTLGFSRWVGVLLIVVLVGFLNYKGEEVIAKLETLGTIALFAAYILFAVVVFADRGEAIETVFENWRTDYLPQPAGMGLLIWTGFLYVGYNLAVYPAAFFTFKGVHHVRESLLAAVISGLLMTVPWFLTYFAILAYYPGAGVLAATVPWLQILQFYHPALVIVFGIVVGWTLVETATGMIHAFISRVETEIQARQQAPLKKAVKALISTAALVASLLLAQVGIIDLVAKGYEIMAYAMMAVFGVPLILYTPKLLQSKRAW
ncbi:MAG: hypothetical protein ACK5V5_06690 [Cyclobacteriaceae bacterium]|jgi:uncharacterized membrane protein YkvI|nr:hypothetical protein [Flammeovirgaceae bacterium]